MCLLAGQQRNHGSILSRNMRFFSFSKPRDQIRGSQNYYSMGIEVFYPGGKSVRA